MNRWQALQRGLSGQYIDDWGVVGGGQAKPQSIKTPPQAIGKIDVPPPLTLDLGRNLSYEEAQARDLAHRIQPPALRAARIGGVAQTPLEAAVTPAGQVEVTRSPWVESPGPGQPFTFMNAAAVTLGAIGTTTVVVTFTVPRRKNGVIEFVANQFVGGGWTEGTGDLIWRITADGIPVQGYDFLIASIGSMSNPGWLGSRPIRIYENQVIALTLQNVAIVPAGQRLLGLFRGGFYPLEQEGQNTWL
jgi:hypothetical protein